MTVKETERLVRVEERQVRMSEDLKRLSDKVDDLPNKLITLLDDRYAPKKEFEEIKETVMPLTRIRRRLWAYTIGFVITIEVASILIWNAIRDQVK